jgi:hypothetical protein
MTLSKSALQDPTPRDRKPPSTGSTTPLTWEAAGPSKKGRRPPGPLAHKTRHGSVLAQPAATWCALDQRSVERRWKDAGRQRVDPDAVLRPVVGQGLRQPRHAGIHTRDGSHRGALSASVWPPSDGPPYVALVIPLPWLASHSRVAVIAEPAKPAEQPFSTFDTQLSATLGCLEPVSQCLQRPVPHRDTGAGTKTLSLKQAGVAMEHVGVAESPPVGRPSHLNARRRHFLSIRSRSARSPGELADRQTGHPDDHPEE